MISRSPFLVFAAGCVLGGLALAPMGCTSAPASGPSGAPVVDLSGIQPISPRPESGGVARVPEFAWRIPGRRNRVDTIIFNLYRADEVDKDARFIRVFDGPIDRFHLNEGQEGMPAMGLGMLDANTDYVWRLTITYQDDAPMQTGEWRFRTGDEVPTATPVETGR